MSGDSGASLLTESLFRTLAQEVLGTTKVTYGEHVFDFGKPFEKLTMREAIKKYRPETDMADLDNFDAAKALAESIGITVEKSWGWDVLSRRSLMKWQKHI